MRFMFPRSSLVWQLPHFAFTNGSVTGLPSSLADCVWPETKFRNKKDHSRELARKTTLLKVEVLRNGEVIARPPFSIACNRFQVTLLWKQERAWSKSRKDNEAADGRGRRVSVQLG